MWAAPGVAGSMPHLAYARLDIARFSTVYSAKGHWTLTDDLASVPNNARPSAQYLDMADNKQTASRDAQNIGTALSIDVVEGIVRDAAAAVLSLQPAGEISCVNKDVIGYPHLSIWLNDMAVQCHHDLLIEF